MTLGFLIRALLAASAFLALALPAQAATTLRIGVIGDVTSAHPDLQASSSSAMIGGLALRGLTYFDGNVEMACAMCETLPTVANGGVVDAPTPAGEPGQKVRFRLKPGLAWDDGTPVTAQDVVLAWNLGRAPDSRYSWRSRLLDETVTATAIDTRTVEIHRRGRACIPSDFRFAALPSRIEGREVRSDFTGYAASSLYVRAPTTPGLYNGPYRVVEFAPDRQKVVLERNPRWSGPRPAYDRIELVHRPSATTMAQALVAGEVDLLANAPLSVADEVARLAPGRFADIRREGRVLMQVALNQDDPRLADVRVRRALLQAIDRPALAASFGPGTAPARSFVTARFPWFTPTLDQAADPDAAARLLEAAGWTPGPDGIRQDGQGRRLAFRLAVATLHADKPFVAMIVEAWRRLGVQVTTEAFTGIGQLTAKAPPPLALFGYQLEGGRNVDFHVFGSRSIPKEGEVRNGLNIFRYRHAETDRIVDKLRDGCDPAELATAYQALQRRVVEDLPLLPLFFQPEAHLLLPSMQPPSDRRAAYLLPQEVETWRDQPVRRTKHP